MAKPPRKPIDPAYQVPTILADASSVQVSYNPDHRLMKITLCSDQPLFGETAERPVIVVRIAMTIPAYNALAKTLQDVAVKIERAKQGRRALVVH